LFAESDAGLDIAAAANFGGATAYVIFKTRFSFFFK
jgi:hypothetical protein